MSKFEYIQVIGNSIEYGGIPIASISEDSALLSLKYDFVGFLEGCVSEEDVEDKDMLLSENVELEREISRLECKNEDLEELLDEKDREIEDLEDQISKLEVDIMDLTEQMRLMREERNT